MGEDTPTDECHDKAVFTFNNYNKHNANLVERKREMVFVCCCCLSVCVCIVVVVVVVA